MLVSRIAKRGLSGARTKSSGHTSDHCNLDHRDFGGDGMFVAATKSAVLGEPGESALDDPSDLELDETFCSFRSSDDIEVASWSEVPNVLREALLLVGTVSEEGLNRRVLTRIELIETGLGPLGICCRTTSDDNCEQQPEAVNDDMAFPSVKT